MLKLFRKLETPVFVLGREYDEVFMHSMTFNAVRAVIESVVSEFGEVVKESYSKPELSKLDQIAFWSFREYVANAIDEVIADAVRKGKDVEKVVAELDKYIKVEPMKYVENPVRPDLDFDKFWLWAYTGKTGTGVGKFGVGMKEASMAMLTLGYATRVLVNGYEYLMWVCKDGTPIPETELGPLTVNDLYGEGLNFADLLWEKSKIWNEYVPCVLKRKSPEAQTGKAVIRVEKVTETRVNEEAVKRIPVIYNKDNPRVIDGLYQYGLFITFTHVPYSVNVNRPLVTSQYRLVLSPLPNNIDVITGYLAMSGQLTPFAETYVETHSDWGEANGMNVLELDVPYLLDPFFKSWAFVDAVLEALANYIRSYIEENKVKPKAIIIGTKDQIARVSKVASNALLVIVPRELLSGKIPLMFITAEAYLNDLYKGRIINAFSELPNDPYMRAAVYMVRAMLPLSLMLVANSLKPDMKPVHSSELTKDCYVNLDDLKYGSSGIVAMDVLYELKDVQVQTNEGPKTEKAVKIKTVFGDIYLIIGIHASPQNVPEKTVAYTTKVEAPGKDVRLIAFNPKYITSASGLRELGLKAYTVPMYIGSLMEAVLSTLTHELMHVLAGPGTVPFEVDEKHGYQFDEVLFSTLMYKSEYAKTFAYVFDYVREELESAFEKRGALEDLKHEGPENLTAEDVDRVFKETPLGDLMTVRLVDPYLYRNCEQVVGAEIMSPPDVKYDCYMEIKDGMLYSVVCKG